MKFDIEKTKIGTKVNIIDYAGNTARGKVVRLDHGDCEPIIVEFSKDADLYASTSATAKYHFAKGGTWSFREDGYYFTNRPDDLRIERVVKKFDIEKIRVGYEVEITDREGTIGKAKVVSIDHSDDDPIMVEFTETCRLFVGGDDCDALAFTHGHQYSFNPAGLYLSNFPNDIRISKIKKPWKKFVGPLKDGMKVRIRYNGKYVKGVVSRQTDDFCVDFETNVEYAGASVCCISYHKDGTPIASDIDERADQLREAFTITHSK